VRSRLAFALVVVALAGCGDDSPVKPVPQPPMDAAGAVTALGEIYETGNLAGFNSFLSDEFVFRFYEPDPETGALQWDAAEERTLHARMLAPAGIPPGDVPLNEELWLQAVQITLTPVIPFAERTDLYTPSNPQGALDSNRWIARGATYDTNALFDLRGETDAQILGRSYFVVLENRSKRIGEAGKFLLYRWEDMGPIPIDANAAAVVPHTWTRVKGLYRRDAAGQSAAAGLITRLAASYRTRNFALFSGLLAEDFHFIFNDPVIGPRGWGMREEHEVHRRMFSTNDPGLPPVPAEYVVQNIQIDLSTTRLFTERRELYSTANPPGPLDPAQWIARGATYATNVIFELAGPTDFQAHGLANFVVLEDRSRLASDPRKFVLYRWLELPLGDEGRGSEPSAVEETSWSAVKSLYRVPEQDAPGLIENLARAYREQNFQAFEALLAPDFLFILDQPNPDTGETMWDRVTENRIHRRMFDPESIPPGDPPLDPLVWLQSVTINLLPEATFVERHDLYTTADPPGPLDPTHWRAQAASYGTNVYFQLQGDTDYLVNGRAYFTVLVDLTKQNGDPGKWLIYRWEDLGMTNSLAVEGASWGLIKGLYR